MAVNIDQISFIAIICQTVFDFGLENFANTIMLYRNNLVFLSRKLESEIDIVYACKKPSCFEDAREVYFVCQILLKIHFQVAVSGC